MVLIRHSHFAFKQRNFDHETRQLRKRGTGDDEEDTVEKAVAGLAEQIIKEDEEKRKEELVRLALVVYVCQADYDATWLANAHRWHHTWVASSIWVRPTRAGWSKASLALLWTEKPG
jgi:hypothetical protein